MRTLAGGLVAAAFLRPGAAAGAEPPPGPRFYVVQQDGQVKAEDVTRSGFAKGADPTLSGKPRKASASEPPGSALPVAPATVRITVSGATPRRDDFEEFRCEEAGFYYTEDARCVVPARTVPMRVRPVPPRLPRR